ncbi:MAG: hypothetical protein ABSG39_10760 [Acidimicrobiales bacterium]|jgi:hypothetical protein
MVPEIVRTDAAHAHGAPGVRQVSSAEREAGRAGEDGSIRSALHVIAQMFLEVDEDQGGESDGPVPSVALRGRENPPLARDLVGLAGDRHGAVQQVDVPAL